jgi:hypothetical protein
MHTTFESETKRKTHLSGRAAYGPYGLGPLQHCDREFESRSKHGCMDASFCVMLSCVIRGLVMGRSPVQGVLLKCPKKIHIAEVISVSEQA